MAAKQTAAAKAAPKATQVEAPAESPTKIHIQAEAAAKAKFREGTARHKWWVRIQEFNGKTLNAFLEDVKAKPPSVPTKPGGKLEGKLEPPQGWIKFFQREGFIKLG